jgi:signal transduction histidine kinase
VADRAGESEHVVHELNNVLTAVAGHTEFVLARLPAESPLRRHVLEIRAAGRRAAQAVSRLRPG